MSNETKGQINGLNGKVALVTGASRGIGAAIAEQLAQAGAVVIGTATSDSGAAAINERLAPLGGAGMRLDVTDSVQIDAVLAEIEARFGAVAVLVNNAGITRDTLIMRMKEEDWDLVISINLKGVFNGIKAVSPIMMKQRSGRIINIASIVGQMGNAGQANYSASKGGVIALTKTAARELASRGVTVNAIAPGFIDTDMTKVLPEDVKDKLKAQIPMGTLGSPDDIAKAVVFLCADAPYITGQVIAINGGMYM